MAIQTNVVTDDTSALTIAESTDLAGSSLGIDSATVQIIEDSLVEIFVDVSASDSSSITITDDTLIKDLAHHAPSVLMNGVWVTGVFKVLVSGVWYAFPAKVYQNGIWT